MWRVIELDGPSIYGGATRIGIWRVLLSLLFGAAGVWCGWRAWHAVLSGGTSHGARHEVRRLFFFAQLGKYVPGSVWPIVLQAQAAREQGISRRRVGVAYVVATGISLATGVFVAMVLPVRGVPQLDLPPFLRYFVAVAALMALQPRVVRRLTDALVRATRGEPSGSGPPPRTAAALMWSIGSWAALGAHVAVLADGLTPLTFSDWVAVTGGTALAFSAGIAAVIAPAGVGVRDVSLALALSGLLSGPSTLSVVIVSRLLLIVVDVLLAGLSAVFEHARR